MANKPEITNEQTQFQGIETIPFDFNRFTEGVALSANLHQQSSAQPNNDIKEIPENLVGIVVPDAKRHAINMIRLIRSTQLGDNGKDHNNNKGRI
jgi:hypothetical protein